MEEKEKKPKNFKFYYLMGGIITLISLIVFLTFCFLPLANKELPNYLGWIALAFCAVSFITFLFGIFLLKKGNYLRFNAIKKDEEEKFKEDLNKLYERKLDENEKHRD